MGLIPKPRLREQTLPGGPPAVPMRFLVLLLLALTLLSVARAAGQEHTPALPVTEPQSAASPAPAPQPSASPAALRWEDGETIFTAAKAELRLANRIQFRWIDELPDSRTQLGGTARPGDARGSFKVRRAKTRLEGWAWMPSLRYELQFSWVGGDPGATASSPLEDAEIVWDVSGKGALELHAGQYKVPFGRQEMTSSEQQQFCDRSILSGEFTRGRDQGLSLQGRLARGKLAYMAGAFNGNQRNRPTNDNDKYQYDVRLVFEPWGEVGYSESDLESARRPLLAVAAQFESNDLHGTTNGDDLATTSWGADLVLKYRGLFVFGEYFTRRRVPELGPAFDSPGFNLQAGYLVWRRRVEIAVRYARWDPSRSTPRDDRSELGGALSYYVRRHHLKIHGDVRALEDRARGTTDHEVRIQTQLVF